MNFRQAILANARTVAGLSTADMKLLMPVLEDSRVATARSLHKWLMKQEADDTYTIATHRQLLSSLDHSITMMKKRLFPAMHLDLQGEAHVAAQQSLIAMKHAAEAGAVKFMASARPLRFDNALIAGDGTKALHMRHAGSAYRYAGRQGEWIRKQLAVGLVKGESVGATVSRLMRQPEVKTRRMSDGDKADEIADREFFTSKADASRLVRTENIYAANEVQQDGLLDDNETAAQDDTGDSEGGWLKRWDATFDSRTCGDCAALDGEVRAPEDEFEPGVMHPPLHPNCRCTIVPWREGWVL